jgi:hypothetical protein
VVFKKAPNGRFFIMGYLLLSIAVCVLLWPSMDLQIGFAGIGEAVL